MVRMTVLGLAVIVLFGVLSARDADPVPTPVVSPATAAPPIAMATVPTTTTPPPPTTISTTAAPTTTALAPTTTVVHVAQGGCGGWRHLIDAHFPGQAERACAVMMCESNGNPNAVSPTDDHGLFQINAPSWRGKFQSVTGVAWGAGVYDPETNVRFAAWLQGAAGWSQWVCAR